jgi:error-prone DNA polymerase
VLLSDVTLLDRTPVEASFGGYPMSQFDKDDVEDLGLLKLDVLGIRMQSSMAHAVTEISRTEGVEVDVDTVALDDPDTFALIQTANTLGCFQIESPGQRELIGKFAPQTFADIIIDISLFRPGPVKSDMVTPFLEARQGWKLPQYLHPDLEEYLRETAGVVVFHEQVIQIIAKIAGCTLAEADEARRGLGDWQGVAGAPGPGAGLRRAGDHQDLGGAAGLCLVRVLQGPRGRLCVAHLPVGLAQGALPGALPVGRAHP